MKDWIPLFQSLVWPIFIVVAAIWFRKGIRIILAAIAERIRSGAPFEAGPSGIKVGTVQQPAPPGESLAKEKDTRSIDDLPHEIYMTHNATRAPSLDRGNLQYFRLRIALDADEDRLLDDVERVIYHLHPTFPDPDRVSTDRRSNFEIKTAAWGEFNMTAEVHLRSGKEKLVIERYINLPKL